MNTFLSCLLIYYCVPAAISRISVLLWLYFRDIKLTAEEGLNRILKYHFSLITGGNIINTLKLTV